jgi:MFS family permease
LHTPVSSHDFHPISKGLTKVIVAGGALFARMGDVFGRKTPVIGSFVAFGVFSIACGFAQNLNQLIAFRALQGLGGSGLYTMVR